MSNIGSTISTTVLHFDNSPVSFEVIVKNLSNNYASFRVNLTAAGADPNIGDDWYSLDPITSTLIPPGDTTKFRVKILNTPIPGIDLINLEVKVSSVELPDINFHNVKLRVSSRVELLKVYLPVDSFAIYPRKILDIPVRVSNPNQHQVDVILRLSGLEPRWLERGSERRLLIGAGKEGEISFTCQPPIVKETPCGIYSFVIKAYVKNEEWGQATGKIEIRPIGTVFFAVTPSSQTLPNKVSWLPQLQTKPAVYQLELKNSSNVAQNYITVAVEDSQCNCQIIPASGAAKPGKALNMVLETTKKRHWWGLKHKYPLKLTPNLSDRRLNTTDPSSQIVELWVHPLLPLWLQLGLGAIATALILWLLSLLSSTGHSDRVTSVTFDSNNTNLILSGSYDGTVQQWKATPDNLLCKWLNWRRFCLQHEAVLLDSKKNGDLDWVNVVKLRSDNNLSGEFAFLGFDSGKVSRLNIKTKREEKPPIIDNQDSSNRIFDIGISPDFSTIFLGRGTGLFKVSLDSLEEKKELINPPNKSIRVLTLTPDKKNIIAGGQYNKIFIFEIDQNLKYQTKEINIHPLLNPSADNITGLKIIQDKLVISTDNRGLIQIWNFEQCHQEKCELLYSHQEGKEQGINAIALSKYAPNQYYLVMGNTKGEIQLWSLIVNEKNIDLNPKKTFTHPASITSIDLIDQQNRLLIISGSQDHQVRLDTYYINE